VGLSGNLRDDRAGASVADVSFMQENQSGETCLETDPGGHAPQAINAIELETELGWGNKENVHPTIEEASSGI
jgi:hypothetical protein